MQFRNFWLINSLGNKYELANQNLKVFLRDPAGFGFERTYTVEQVGTSEIVTAQQFSLGNITGTLMFYDLSAAVNYQNYQDFIKFCKYKPLEFHYQMPNSLSSYFCDVLFTTVTKGEVEEDGCLKVPVTFHRLSQWLTDEDYEITLTNTLSDSGKYFPLIRPYHYAGTTLSNTVINNNGTDDVGFVMTITGTCQNPTFTLTQNVTQYGACKLTGTFDYVLLDSVEKNEQIYLENNGTVISNPQSKQDFSIANGQSYLTWCKFKVGQTILNFTCGNIDTFDGTINISFKNSYVSV